MADQGFAHNLPVIVLPQANQPQIPRIMRRYFEMSNETEINTCCTKIYFF